MNTIRHLGLVLALMLTGCSTAHLHFGGPEAVERTPSMGPAPRYVYAGTQSNLEDLAILLPGNTSGDALYDGLACMFFFIPLIDLPLSLVADTVFLPYDAYKVTIGGKTRYGEDELPTRKSTLSSEGAPSDER